MLGKNFLKLELCPRSNGSNKLFSYLDTSGCVSSWGSLLTTFCLISQCHQMVLKTLLYIYTLFQMTVKLFSAHYQGVYKLYTLLKLCFNVSIVSTIIFCIYQGVYMLGKFQDEGANLMQVWTET